MSDENIVAPRADHQAYDPLQCLAHQLQEILDALKSNADSLAGDLFHHDALFQSCGSVPLDEKLAVIIEELKSVRPQLR